MTAAAWNFRAFVGVLEGLSVSRGTERPRLIPRWAALGAAAPGACAPRLPWPAGPCPRVGEPGGGAWAASGPVLLGSTLPTAVPFPPADPPRALPTSATVSFWASAVVQ